jgi:hypothetical protein
MGRPMAEPKDDWEDVDWEDASPLRQDFSDAGSTGRTPGPESVAPEPYGPEFRPELAEPSAMDTARGAVASLLQGPTFQWADELAGMHAKQNASVENIFKPDAERVDPELAYTDARDSFRAAEGAFRDANPKTSLGLTVLGGLAAMNPGALAPAFSTRAVGAGVTGAIAGAGAAEEAEDMGFGALIGAPLGVAAQALGEGGGALFSRFLGAVGRGVSRLGNAIVEPSPAAATLARKGVTNLTVGQMAPTSKLAQLEEAGTSIAGIGPAIKGQRDAALGSLQQATLKEVLPPGVAAVPPGGSIGEQLGGIRRAFDAAYAPAKGHNVDPTLLRKSLDAIDNPAIYADDALRTKLAKWLTNQMTAVRLRGPGGGAISDDVIALRSNLRDMSARTQNEEERALLRAAEDEITSALDAGLPPQVALALKTVDQQFAKYRTVADAVWSSMDQPSGFTTGQFSSAVRANTPRRLYEEGGGGALREMSDAAAETIAPKIPLTGMRLLAAGPVPYVTGPFSYAANLPGPKRALLGQTGVQQSLRSGSWTRPLIDAAKVASPETTGAATRAAMGQQPSTGDLVQQVAANNPEALGSYAETLQRAAAEGNLSLVHWSLQQKDPQYRAMLEALRKEQPQ